MRRGKTVGGGMLRDVGIALSGALLLSLGGYVFASRKRPAPATILIPDYSVARPETTDLYDPARQYWKRGVAERREVLLTFDDGPHGADTARILDTLKRKGTPGVFFVVGKMVERHPKLARRMIAEGHEIGNHTWDHCRLDTFPEERIVKELAAGAATIERATGRRALLMRPPGMRCPDALVRANRALGLVLVGWTIGAKDYVGDVPKRMLPTELHDAPATTPEMVVERVRRQLKPGAIILLHDNGIVADALPGVIDAIHEEGYTVTTAAKMLSRLPQGVELRTNPPLTSRTTLAGPGAPR